MCKMSRKARIPVAIFVLCLFLFLPSRYVFGRDAKVIDDDGDEYMVEDLKSYGNVSGTWLEEPQYFAEEIIYPIKKGETTTYTKIQFSDIKEISFEHEDRDDDDAVVINVQIIKRNEDILELDYRSYKIVEKSKGGKITHYEMPESEKTPNLLGDLKMEGKPVLWQGFVGKEILGEKKRGRFFIHSSLIKKLVFQHDNESNKSSKPLQKSSVDHR